MIKQILIFTSSVLALVSPIVYARAVLRGEAKPHRTTRLVLLIITSLATASLIASGNRVAIYLAGVSTFQSIIVFILSIKYGMGGWEKSDIGCLVIAMTGIFFWQITKDPKIGLYFSILADFVGMIPTIIKTYKNPETEIWLFFGMDSLAGFLNILAIKNWTVSEVIFPVYIMMINLVMVILITRGKEIQLP